MLRPRERRRPVMPNQLSPVIEQRIVAFALGHPGLGPKRIAAQLSRPEWGGLLISPNGVYKALVRHGLNTRTKRLALVAGYRARYEPPRDAPPEPRIESSRPGELVGIDCFLRRAPARYIRHGLAAHRDRHPQLLRLGRAGHQPRLRCQRRAHQPPGPSRRRRPPSRGWRLDRVLSDNGNEFRSVVFTDTLAALGARHSRIRSGRPQTNGHVERLQRTILEECWRPAFARFLQVRLTGLRRELDSYLDYYNRQRAHTGRMTTGRCPADSSTVPARWSRDEPQLSAHPGDRSA
jgi:transposase InsO family protein